LREGHARPLRDGVDEGWWRLTGARPASPAGSGASPRMQPRSCRRRKLPRWRVPPDRAWPSLRPATPGARAPTRATARARRPSMKSRTRLFASVLAALAILTVSTPVRSAEFRTGGNLTVPVGDTLRDDLYVCGGKVSIDGVVLGDVVACGGNIQVNGT